MIHQLRYIIRDHVQYIMTMGRPTCQASKIQFRRIYQKMAEVFKMCKQGLKSFVIRDLTKTLRIHNKDSFITIYKV